MPTSAAPEVPFDAPAPTRRSVAGGIEIRITVPRTAFPNASPPDYFSQRNCEAQLGIGRRRFLELLRAGA